MSQSGEQLDPAYCRRRQQRLLEVMQRRRIDRVVLASTENVQYLTGFRPPHRLHCTCASIDSDGWCTLIVPNQSPEQAEADWIETFEANKLATFRQDQQATCASVLKEVLSDRKPAKSIAVEFSSCPPHLQEAVSGSSENSLIDIDSELLKLRRCKDPDELALIRRAIACTDAMYRRAREIIQPGISELEVFNELHAAAVQVAGEPLTALGNDYQCNSPGGPPRPRKAQEGELFILDLGPAYRGYYADNCRTFSVNRQPTDEQQQAWEAIVSVLEMVEATVRPGVSSRKLYQQAKSMLDEHREGAFFHHLGHGFGLFPHATPHLNPNWDDTFEEGDVFTAEPGLYWSELKAGIRLEQNYLVTADGLERLTNFPLEL